MKILKSNLLAAIATPAKIAKVKATRPILSTIRIEATNGIFTATGNNLDEFAMSKTECEGELEPCCISERQLSSIIALLPDEIEMHLVKQLCFGEDFKLSVMDASAFPTWKMDGSIRQGVPCADLKDCIESVAWAAPVHDGRQNLYAVHIKCSAKTIMAEATTGQELARCLKNLIGVDLECCVPVPFVDNLCDALGMDGAVLSLSPNIVSVEYDGGQYGCKLSEHKFLNSDYAFTESVLIGEIHVDKWLPLVNSAIAINGVDNKQRCDILVGKHFEYVGDNGSISPLTPELLTVKEPLKLNAIPFSKCLSAFNGEPVKVSLTEGTAVKMECGDLTVMCIQMR